MYPNVDTEKCIDCGVCVKHCPIMSDCKAGESPQVFAAKYNNKEDVFKSTSGGIFLPLAETILEKGGVVFGCSYDDNLVAKHICVENKEDLHKLQGSKYVQSDLQGIYSKVKNELINNRYVLFSGTGCQTAGLQTFLGKDYDKLFLVDIVCHGVPSPELFANYIDWMGKKLGGKLTSYNFRSKEKHGWALYYKATTSKKSKSSNGFFDPYYNAFLNCKTYRESCYSCKFANANRTGDITLADYWGIETISPDFYDKNGVSLVLVNSEKGKKLWSDISSITTTLPSTIENAKKMNKNLSAPSSRPECRDTIYDGYDGDFDKYVSEKLTTSKQLKRRIKALIPISLKGKIKHMFKKF